MFLLLQKKSTLIPLYFLAFLGFTTQLSARAEKPQDTFKRYFEKKLITQEELLDALSSCKKSFIYGNKGDIPKMRNVVSICIPKCGTHLLLKCIELFGVNGITDYAKEIKPSPQKLARIRRFNKSMPPKHYKGEYYSILSGGLPNGLLGLLRRDFKSRKHFWSHWAYTPRFEHFLQYFQTSNLLMMRDPRDMVVSFAFMVHKSREGQTADLEKVIIDLITGKQQYYLPWAVEIQQVYPLLWELGLYKFYRLYMPFIKSNNFLVVRFEDLIGERGGGSAQKQIEIIKKIGRHIRVASDDATVKSIIDRLFGGTWTFREGQTGSWKKYFTPAIKTAFKRDKELLKLLVDLGYENDTEWIDKLD